MVYQFPRAAITKVPQTEWLTKTEIYFLMVWQTGVQNPDTSRAMLPPETLPCLFLVSGGWPLIAGAPWPTVTPLQPLRHQWHSPMCVCLHMSFPSSYKDTSHIVLVFPLITSS